MDFEEDNRRIKEEYSRQFIESLKNKPKVEVEDVAEPSFFANKYFIGGVIAIFIIILSVFIGGVIEDKKNKSLHDFADLYFSIKKSKVASAKYRNLINNRAIRSENSNFYVTLSGIEATLEDYKKGLNEEKSKKADQIIKEGDETINQVLNKLEEAYLNESLDRVYLDQMTILIKEMQEDILSIIKNTNDSNFTEELSEHYKSLDRIKKSTKKTNVED